ncbi:preprotein translocase subunit SecY [Rarobacter faecitabidus]|uniref:Protein translocase subunit SecY n=1 Tax=Rarobacter faecitabidus TaxID=13243 RepID=A0A542ZXJ4_RARFA|nr:preprotein translocase subunit SecY [Rarobacter faecitabidus]TQL65077.1 protein translocase subunit secY/sec61 alpha [Rarobacter faecitabidus]
MLSAFARAFRTPDLRRKLLFTIAIMALYRVGSFVPSAGVDYQAVRACVETGQASDFIGLVNLFSGGALMQLSIFALGIMPYITASIIVQLLRVVIPRFETLHKEGQSGQAKLTQYTRYLTIGLAILQATTYTTMARTGVLLGCEGSVLSNDGIMNQIIVISAMTAGTGLIMWLGEIITERGIGNGMSLLIFTSIAATLPTALWGVAGGSAGIGKFVIIMAIALLVVVAIVFVEQSQRRIQVQYAKRMVGRRMYGGSSTYIPIKINMANVIPVIFASSILAVPGLIGQFSGNPNAGWAAWVQQNITATSSPLHLALYTLLIIFFTFFYVAITFNPTEVADNMKNYGGFIPGYRAGRPTAEYLQYVITRITSAGSIYLALVALIPTIAMIQLGVTANIPFGGTSILILVGVGLETVKQIDAQLQQRHYEGLLR